MSEWKQFGNREELDQTLSDHIAEQLRREIDQQGAASLALSGGSTPKQMFTRLSKQALDWSKVWITLVDDRWVDPTSEDSNERMLREHLLQNAAEAAHFVGLMGTVGEAQAQLDDISQRLAELPRPLTMAVLGMGADGHTASWFPRAANLAQLLDERGEARLAVSDPVTAPHQRITQTLSSVLDAREIAIHIVGDDKKTVLENARRENYPVAAILRQTATPASIWWAPL